MGIEPTSEAWEASILPLNYTREKPYTNFFRISLEYLFLNLIALGQQVHPPWSRPSFATTAGTRGLKTAAPKELLRSGAPLKPPEAEAHYNAGNSILELIHNEPFDVLVESCKDGISGRMLKGIFHGLSQLLGAYFVPSGHEGRILNVLFRKSP